MEELSVSNNTISLPPASNLQLLFERRLLEENIQFQKYEGSYKSAYIKYTFYETDIAFVNQIMDELNKEAVEEEESIRQRSKYNISKTQWVFLIIIVLYVLFLIFFS
ncbi:MAG: hypothetical protein NTZ33_13020 [Bacteroidetes bacterium]|nr:hypothetical protein [Bacteroidota bacterium]